MQMSLFCLLFRMDRSQKAVEGTAESVNPMDLDPSVSDSARSEHASTEALFKIS